MKNLSSPKPITKPQPPGPAGFAKVVAGGWSQARVAERAGDFAAAAVGGGPAGGRRFGWIGKRLVVNEIGLSL